MGALNKGVYNFDQQPAQDIDSTESYETEDDKSFGVSNASDDDIEVAFGDSLQNHIDHSGYEADLSSNEDAVSLHITSLNLFLN